MIDHKKIKRPKKLSLTRSQIMARIRSKDTQPEMIVRRLIYSLGYRYKLHKKDLPGKPDLVFFRRKKVIFVHGCFWHEHNCRAGLKKPKSNQGFWIPKLERNAQRDKENQDQLVKMGWKVLVIWECELNNKDRLIEVIKSFLDVNRH